MQKKLICGIDISAETLDACYQTHDGKFEHLQIPNDASGFKKLMLVTGENYHFVMEATGVYYLALAFYIDKQKAALSVVNALQIKRFIQMHLERNKSDKKDAKWICEYGINQGLELWQMPDNLYFECKTLNNAIGALTNEQTTLKNQIHALKKLPISNKVVLKSFERMLKHLQAEIKILEAELLQKMKEWQPEMYELVSSVVGIGKRAASVLIVYTQGFKFTENYKQLISFAGLSPKEYSSGSSIRGKSRICKQGGHELRHILYMCALNAKSNNPACKLLFDRLVVQGKNKKSALIAVCNKLLKQIFGVVKNKQKFDKDYLQKIA